MFTLYIQTNSPGELSTWVRPVCESANRLFPNTRIVIFLTPCQYASGYEKKWAEQLPGVVCVYSPRETLRFLFSRGVTQGKGAVLYLGGDPFYSRILSWKLKVPSVAYTEARHSPGGFFKKVFFKHEVGDLMACQAAGFSESRESVLSKYGLEDRPYCLFLAGSRPHHLEHYLPVISEVMAHILKKEPDFPHLFLLSPFIGKELRESILEHPQYTHLKWVEGDSLEIMSISSFMVTLPGSNTAQAMYMKLPMMMFLPLHRPDLIPFDGLLGLLGSIPILGGFLKRSVIRVLLHKKPMISLPNKLFKKRIVPEIYGAESLPDLADQIRAFYHDDAMLSEMKQIFQTHVVSTQLVDDIVRTCHAL
jgi:lipid-A-disaccharide synthase